MPQSLASIYVHATFSTLDRSPLIENPSNLHAYLGGISKQMGCHPVIAGGVADHVHILSALSRTVTVADWIKELKRVSSIYMKQVQPRFAWQSGYGAFSVGREQIEAVRAYIANQEAHHRKVSFQDEYRLLLEEQGVTWDERYVWD